MNARLDRKPLDRPAQVSPFFSARPPGRVPLAPQAPAPRLRARRRRDGVALYLAALMLLAYALGVLSVCVVVTAVELGVGR